MATGVEFLTADERLRMPDDGFRHELIAYRSRSSIRVYTDTEKLDASDVVPGWTFEVARAFDRNAAPRRKVRRSESIPEARYLSPKVTSQ